MPNRITNMGSNEWPFSLEFFKFVKFLGIESRRDALGVTIDKDIVRKTRALFDWAKKNSDTQTFAEAILKTENLRRQLGTNYIGEELVNRLFREIEWKRLSEEAATDAEEREQLQHRQTWQPETMDLFTDSRKKTIIKNAGGVKTI